MYHLANPLNPGTSRLLALPHTLWNGDALAPAESFGGVARRSQHRHRVGLRATNPLVAPALPPLEQSWTRWDQTQDWGANQAVSHAHITHCHTACFSAHIRYGRERNPK
jgi:hypothetical protein